MHPGGDPDRRAEIVNRRAHRILLPDSLKHIRFKATHGTGSSVSCRLAHLIDVPALEQAYHLSIVIKQSPALGSPSELPRVAMVQPTETGNRHDLPHFSRIDRPRFWSVLC